MVRAGLVLRLQGRQSKRGGIYHGAGFYLQVDEILIQIRQLNSQLEVADPNGSQLLVKRHYVCWFNVSVGNPAPLKVCEDLD